MIRPVVGVTVHDDVVRAIEVHRGSPRAWGELTIEPGVVEQGEIVDHEAFAQALRQLWKTAGFSTKRVGLAIEAEAATIRRQSLPANIGDDVAEAVGYDIAELLSYPVEEAVIDHAVVDAGTSSDGERPAVVEDDAAFGEVSPFAQDRPIETLVVAVRRVIIDDYAAATKAAGLRWVRAELAPAANVSLISGETLKSEGCETLGAVVSIGERTTTVSVHDDQGLVFARVLMAGVGDSASLSYELASQLAEVESLRSGNRDDSGGTNDTIDEAPGVGVVAEGIRRTLLYHSSDIDRRPVDRIRLCGSRSRANGLLGRVIEAMPTAAVSLVEHDDWPLTEQAERFDTAFAAAALIQAPTDDRGRALSLVPESVVTRRSDRRAAAVGSVVALGLVLAAYADHGARSEELTYQREAVSLAESSGAQLASEVERLADVREMADVVGERQARVAALADRRVAVPALLGRLAAVMPADTVLQSIEIDTGGRTDDVFAADVDADLASGVSGDQDFAAVSISAAAPDLDGVAAWIDAAVSSGVLTDVQLMNASVGEFGAGNQAVAIFEVEARATSEVLVPLPDYTTEAVDR